MHKDLHGRLGIAQKAGLLVSGQDAVRQAVKNGTVVLILLAEDASPRTLKEFTLLAESKGIPWRQGGTRQEFGAALGKPDRAVIAMTDRGFAKSMLAKMPEI